MGKAERSLFIFGLYLILAPGAGFMIMPTFILDTFQLPYGDDVWIRFVGLLAFIIGGYYLVTARERLKPLYRWTVWMRLFAGTFMVLMMLIGKVGTAILLFAALDYAGAVWTWLSLEKVGSMQATTSA
ncbi:MAG: hypothetical protein ACK4TA_14350 [Saprospiraceae bacterium]